MLMPKKVKFRKQQRGRMSGTAKGGTRVTFGDYGIQALECAVSAAYALGITWIILKVIDKTIGLRVTTGDEGNVLESERFRGWPPRVSLRGEFERVGRRGRPVSPGELSPCP